MSESPVRRRVIACYVSQQDNALVPYLNGHLPCCQTKANIRTDGNVLQFNIGTHWVMSVTLNNGQSKWYAFGLERDSNHHITQFVSCLIHVKATVAPLIMPCIMNPACTSIWVCAHYLNLALRRMAEQLAGKLNNGSTIVGIQSRGIILGLDIF